MTEMVKHPNGRGNRTRPEEDFVTPRADVRETAEELLLELDLPGVKAEDVDVHFDRGELTVRAKAAKLPTQGRSWLTVEYQPADFERTFRLSPEVDVSKVVAELKGGVLTLHLPKSEAARTRRINVKGE
jgi:HSP20 family molecular chaperone IbpA